MPFESPFGFNYSSDLEYRPHYYLLPAAADKPHFSMVMLDPTVAPEGKMLESELRAAATLLHVQTRSKRFTNHHTKPVSPQSAFPNQHPPLQTNHLHQVLVITFQWETHARLTQAHVDAETNKIVIRQSRLFEIAGPTPPPDALLLLRWMINSPVGTTKYEDGDGADGAPAEGQGGREKSGGVGMSVSSPPASSKVVGVKSG